MIYLKVKEPTVAEFQKDGEYYNLYDCPNGVENPLDGCVCSFDNRELAINYFQLKKVEISETENNLENNL